MTATPYHYRLREPYGNPKERGAPPPNYGRTVEHGMIIERNVAVPMRDGVRLYADVFRPANERPGPPIVIWTPYGKHWYGALELDPNTAVRADMLSRYATFEGADPLHWVPLGYVVVNVDARGTWYSEGTSTFLSPQEAESFYDVIEWAGVADRAGNGPAKVFENAPPGVHAARGQREPRRARHPHRRRHRFIPSHSHRSGALTRPGSGSTAFDLRRATRLH